MLVKKTCTSNKKLGCEELITYIQLPSIFIAVPYKEKKIQIVALSSLNLEERPYQASKQLPLALSFFY